MATRRTRLQRLLATLADYQGGARPVAQRDPWHLILLENVVYLVGDEARARGFAVLREHTRLDAATIEGCPDELLQAACGEGRMVDNLVRKLRECSVLFSTVGDPRDLVKLPLAKARRALKRFPGIGNPGADKLLLFAGVEPVLALDSNGLRVLLRLGYGRDAKAYSTSYKSAQEAAMAELPADPGRADAGIPFAAAARSRDLSKQGTGVPGVSPSAQLSQRGVTALLKGSPLLAELNTVLDC